MINFLESDLYHLLILTAWILAVSRWLELYERRVDKMNLLDDYPSWPDDRTELAYVFSRLDVLNGDPHWYDAYYEG